METANSPLFSSIASIALMRIFEKAIFNLDLSADISSGLSWYFFFYFNILQVDPVCNGSDTFIHDLLQCMFF